MKKSSVRFSFLLVLVAMALSACATKRSVIARKNPGLSPTFQSRISIPKRDLRTLELDELGRVVNAELVRRGVTLVSSAKSDYALSFWIEQNWEGGSVATGRLWDSPPISSSSLTLQDYQAKSHSAITQGDIGRLSKGIRLRLFVSHPKGTNLLETAWDGYVDGGPRMSSKDYGPLVRILMDHFGQDFVGKVKLDE